MTATLRLCVFIFVSASVSGLGAAAGAAGAPQAIEREIIPGSELMTHRERERYRQRMRAATTLEQQNAVREGHVAQMRERARLRGLALPDHQRQGAR